MNKRIQDTIINPSNIDHTRTLKPADRLFHADPVWEVWERINPDTGKWQSVQFEEVYRQAEQAKLGAHVPAEIREHFATALNLVAYSWYFYPFTTQAEFAAYTTVERALKLRFGYAWNSRPSFRAMLTRAVDEGLLTEAGFPHMASLPPVQPIDGQVVTRLDLMKRIILDARNTMAHGGSRLHPNGAHFVIMAAELINQLFDHKPSAI